MKIDVRAVKVQVTVVGVEPLPQVTWPEAWPVPREGDSVILSSGPSMFVRTVAWYPEGDPEPFVYVVVGQAV